MAQMKRMKTQLGLGWTKALSILSLDDWGVWKHITFNFEDEEIKPKEFTILCINWCEMKNIKAANVNLNGVEITRACHSLFFVFAYEYLCCEYL